MGDFICQLDGNKGCPESWPYVTSGATVRVSREETSISISRLSKEEVWPPPMQGGSIQSTEGRNRTKTWRKGD